MLITFMKPLYFGAGVVFKLDTAKNETVLHSFSGSPDGAHPIGTSSIDNKSNLYGTTLNGDSSGGGTVFEVDASGHQTLLHTFIRYAQWLIVIRRSDRRQKRHALRHDARWRR